MGYQFIFYWYLIAAKESLMEVLIIFLLTLLNVFFALSEIALVPVKRNRIEHLSALGNGESP